MKFPTPEEMKERAYANHGITDEQKDELEMMIRHKMQAGQREFYLHFNNCSVDRHTAFKFLRLMEYDVCRGEGMSMGDNLLVKI